MAKRVVIIGAGYAGIAAALALNKKNKSELMDITIIDKNDYHTLLTELHEVAANRIAEDGIIIPLQRIFGYTGIRVIKDCITSFDFANRKVVSASAEYAYDYLVMALGSETNFFGIPGAKEHAFTLWSYDDALKIRAHINDCFVKAVHEKNAARRASLLTFTVVGAGFTGSEMVGELVYYARDLCRQYSINRKDVNIKLLDAMDKVLPIFGGKNSEKAHKKMTKMGIDVILNAGCKEISPKGLTYGNTSIACDTVIWTAGVRAKDDVDAMDIEKQRAFRLKVDENCLTNYPNVYAIGDVCAHSDTDGKMYPAMVENALYTGKGVAKNILHDIKGEKPERVVVSMHGAMVCVGPFFAASDLMGWKLPSWLSMVMKYMVNAHYLWEIVGCMGVSRYLYHEVIQKKQRRFFFEKHWSTRMQAWWLAPLRMFLGVMWLYEGIVKVTEKWFIEPKLAAFLGLASDTATSASSSGDYITRYNNIFRLDLKVFDFLLGSETRVVRFTEGIGEEATIRSADISEKLFSKLQLLHFGDFDIMNWFCRNVVVANDGVAMFFQIMVVLMEIGVGLLLISGFFNFPAAIVSTGLMIMFWTTTGIYQETWFMLFASIAVMGGAGRAFGIDHYAVPYISNLWERSRKNSKFSFGFKNALTRWNDK